MQQTKVYVVVDLGFGDAGKGTVVDYLVRTRKAGTVVRFNGGAQAAHNVTLPDGRRHPFSQFGSGTFVPGVKTYLTEDVLFDPNSLLGEEAALQALGVTDAFERFAVHEECLVVTPFHRTANRLREVARGDKPHGSCGMGIGEAMSDATGRDKVAIRVKDLLLPADELRRKLEWVRQYNEGKALVYYPKYKEHQLGQGLDPSAVEWFLDQCRRVADLVTIADDAYEDKHVFNCDSDQVVVCEGAQGVLLDEHYGFHPYTTWSTVTPHRVLEKIREANYITGTVGGEVERVGVTRAYQTRHGAGPFPTWERGGKAWEHLGAPDANKEHEWQGKFRVGWLDTVLLRYAIEACSVPWSTQTIDWLAVTCLDRLHGAFPQVPVCTHYVQYRADAKKVRHLPVARRPTLGGQEILTEFLMGAQPSQFPRFDVSYQAVDYDHLLPYIEQQVGVPVGLSSRGPTWQDKLEHEAWVVHGIYGKTKVKHGPEEVGRNPGETQLQFRTP